jgi:predicted dehydrogenase/aryl-alcohol dehydrogenase-like predicted oxidoreductase
MSAKIKWGLLACGAIAKAFAKGLKNSETGSLYAAASRSEEKARKFAEEFGAEKYYGSYESLLADPGVDAVYISTPHPMHTEWAIKAAEAGKHILVEKPIAINQYEAMSIIQAAAENDVFLMEAYMYRCNPQTLKLREILREKPIGDIAVIKATFSFGGGLGSSGRLWTNELGGGGILDVGGYTTSFSRLVAGEAVGQPFADPYKVSGAARLHPETGVDAWAAATLEFPGGIIAQISTGIGVSQNNIVEIFGTHGRIAVANPYIASRGDAQNGEIALFKRGAAQETISIPAPVNSYTCEADVCGRAIQAGLREAAEMTWADTMGNIRAQDSWRQAAGLVYDSEKIEHMPASTYANRKLEHRSPLMKPGRIQYLNKDISRLIMGVDNQVTSPHAQAVFDHYYEHGGNALDTAFIYGELKSRLVGQWMKSRGVRDDMVIIAKGAHTPNCNPKALTSQLVQQLEWLSTDYADIYLMHRDNPEIPVGEFMDVMNEHVKAGRIKTFGGSNWSLDRIEQANAYAKKKGLQPMSICSNNLSLAVMVKPVWDGCIHVHDDKSLAWLEKNQMALLPWSSQARGFFVPALAHPDRRTDASLVKSWYSKENFERQRRAIEVSKKYGVEPINISLAWVLGQKFPVFALIGPRTLAETRSSMRSLEIKLTPEEMACLDLK